MKKLSLSAVLLFCLILVGCGTSPKTETIISPEPVQPTADRPYKNPTEPAVQTDTTNVNTPDSNIEGNSLIGVWKAVSVAEKNKVYTGEEMEKRPSVFFWAEFKKNGTVVFSNHPDRGTIDTSSTYKVDGDQITFDQEYYFDTTAKIIDGKLVISTDSRDLPEGMLTVCTLEKQ